MADMDDTRLLAIVEQERRNSIGFDHDDELADAREKALDYYKGEMPDLPTLPNRSRAVSTDVADAVETILPDLVEIFVGEDVASFSPVGPEDEEGAQQETDYINHVFFQQNAGFMTLYTAFKDALLVKTGVIKWWWQDEEYGEDEVFEGQTAMQAQSLAQYGQIVSVEQTGGFFEPLYTVTLRQIQKPGCVKIKAFPPEDFTVARDTVSLQEATYCALRSRRRAQDLIVDGVSREIVDQLGAYDHEDEGLEDARDTADENEEKTEGVGDLREVEVVEHYIRLEGKLYRVLTGNQEGVLIEKEEIDQIPVAALTPYPQTHRFYGISLADKLLEIQRINTTLTRMVLDSGYFAQNQRFTVNINQATDHTLSDLLRNEPMAPVRVEGPDAVRPLSAPGLGFDAFAALEYFQTVAEKRTGIVRNAQGLNPDTLHDTARGMEALVGAAQKRVRMIARIFAETGVKDAFLGVHALIRKHVSSTVKARLRNTWVDIDPTSWGNRNDMVIEIGVGSSGVNEEIARLNNVAGMMERVRQDPVYGQMVTPENVYNLFRRIIEKSGFKAPEKYITDPSQIAPQQGGDDGSAAEAAKLQRDVQIEQIRAETQIQIAREKMAAEAEIERQKYEAKMALEREQLAEELALKRELAFLSARGPGPADVHVGGEPG